MKSARGVREMAPTTVGASWIAGAVDEVLQNEGEMIIELAPEGKPEAPTVSATDHAMFSQGSAVPVLGRA